MTTIVSEGYLKAAREHSDRAIKNFWDKVNRPNQTPEELESSRRLIDAFNGAMAKAEMNNEIHWEEVESGYK